jgi:hypothetical protein
MRQRRRSEHAERDEYGDGEKSSGHGGSHGQRSRCRPSLAGGRRAGQPGGLLLGCDIGDQVVLSSDHSTLHPGEPNGLAAKFRIAELRGLQINSVERLRELAGLD